MKNAFLRRDFQILTFVLCLTTLVQINTLFNQFTYDDALVITHNQFVQQGIKGIPQLITNSFYAGFDGQKSLLAADRYRPVALVTFALENSLFGINPFLSHLVNLLLFLILLVLLQRFLLDWFSNWLDSWGIGIALLFFAIHPLHTEVIANIKSRDEILSFIFIFQSVLCLKRQKYFVTGIWFLLAMFTKESAITFIGIIPLLTYFFGSGSKSTLLRSILPYLIATTLFIVIRSIYVGNQLNSVSDIGNSPYFLASSEQAFTTKVYLLFKYIMLLFYPYSLSYEYGFNQIPYLNYASPQFWMSAIILFSLLLFAIVFTKRKSPSSFLIYYFFVTIFLASNLVLDLGAIFAERMAFVPSLAFALLIGMIFQNIFSQIKFNLVQVILSSILLIYFGFFSLLTWQRNKVWFNNETLFLNDVQTSPNSIRANQNAAKVYLQKAFPKPSSNPATANTSTSTTATATTTTANTSTSTSTTATATTTTSNSSPNMQWHLVINPKLIFGSGDKEI